MAYKRLAGRILLELCEQVPATKNLLRKWGMRTAHEWFTDRIVRVQLPDGQSLSLAGLGENYLSFELFWKGTGYYEPITTLVARELVKPGATFIDVGANIGFYSLVLSHFQPSLAVIAFEPNPKLFRLLQVNVRLNSFDCVCCQPVALSDQNGSAVLHLTESDMSASLESDFQPEIDAVEVTTATLDSYLRRQPVDGALLIKVDVEGHEAAFFHGATETLQERRPDVICEFTGPADKEITAILRKTGYRFYEITDDGLLPASELKLIVRGRFLFLNYLLSTKPPEQIAQIFQRIQGRVREIDLAQTSKCVDPDVIRHLQARETATREQREPRAKAA
jgi:FkbM family methyltransferase